MSRLRLAHCTIAVLVLAGCGREPAEPVENQANETASVENQAQTPAIDPADMPPPIVRSPSYRCDDGKALYVDVLGDKQAVLVRDSRSDVPTRLERDGDSGPFTGNGTSLSGTGNQVRYSSPDRASQSCREAAA